MSAFLRTVCAEPLEASVNAIKYTDRANDELHGVPPTRTLERPTTELGEIPAYPSPVTRRISSASHVKILEHFPPVQQVSSESSIALPISFFRRQ